MNKFLTEGHKKLYHAFCDAQYNGKLTRLDIAKKIGVSSAMVSYIFKGKRMVESKEIKRLALKHFGVPVADWDKLL